MKIEVGDLVCSEYTGRTGMVIDITHGPFDNKYTIEWYDVKGTNYTEEFFNESAIIKWKREAKKQQQAVDSRRKR